MDLETRFSPAMAVDPPRVLSDPPPSVATGVGAPLRPSREGGPAAAAPGPVRFARVLDALGRETERGERVMRAALEPRGGRADPSELLALQAAIYRYTEVVDLASHLVDRAASALKTVLGGGGS